MAEYTKEEVLAELQRRSTIRQQEQKDAFKYSQALKAFTTGAGSMGMTSSEQEFPGYERFFRAGEGAGPGAVGGAAVGGPLGAIVGGTAGMLGNIAAKELFPSSPTAQTIMQLMIPGGQTALRARGGAIPSAEAPFPRPSTTPAEGSEAIPMTFGQRTGDVGTLVEEAKVARTIRGGPIADAFRIAQAESVDDFFLNVQKFQSNPNLTQKEISSGVFKAFDDYTRKIANKFKAQNTQNFNQVKKIAGNSNIIPTTNVQASIDDLIRTYDNPEVPGRQNIVSTLKKIKSELTTTKTTTTGGVLIDERGRPLVPEVTTTTVTPDKINIERLQQNLSAWGEAAYKGTFGGLDDLSPGQIKGISRKVLNAFKADLDDAAQSGVKGAEALQDARTAYSNNLKTLNEIADKPIFKFFDKTSAESLVPEQVIRKFITLPPSQKAEVAAVMQNSRPDIWDSLRSQGLNQILSKARVGEAAPAGSPKFDLRTALKDLGKLDDPQIQWLFPTKAEKNEFRAGLLSLQKIQKDADLFDPTSARLREVEQALEQGAGAWGGAVRKYGAQAAFSALRVIIGTADEQKLAAIMFNPNGKVLIRELAKNKPNMKAVDKSFESVSAGLFGSAITAREVPQEVQSEFSIEEAQAEAIRRGLIAP
jgi:hypothetical protein